MSKQRRARSWHSTQRLPRPQVMKVAAAAECDATVVVKYLDGGTITEMSRARVERGLRETGHEDLITVRAAAPRLEPDD